MSGIPSLYDQHDAVGLAALVQQREVAPSELVDEAIRRIERLNPAINAVVYQAAEIARRVASDSAFPHSAPLAGVPFLLKDLITCCKGMPSTESCALLAHAVPDFDSELVVRYKRAGLVILGKTNTPEFGMMPVTESRFRGPARNPWNLGYTPGGSSGGAAAAVAAGIVPAAHGSDGGGSIRMPASCCGLFGLKPTRGRNPLGPRIGDALAGFFQEHVITRSVRDSAVFLDATHGPDEGAPYWAPPVEGPFRTATERPPDALRIAWTSTPLFGSQPTHSDCREAVEDAARLCADLGHTVEEAAPRLDREALYRAFLTICAVDTLRIMRFAARVAGTRLRYDDFEPQTWFLGLIGSRIPAAEYADAIEASRRAARRLAPFFARYDLLLTPTLCHPPVPIGFFRLQGRDRLWIEFLRRVPLRSLLDPAFETLSATYIGMTGNTMLFNMTGQPAASVPLFWNAVGLPIGVQFAARFGREDVLFALSAQLEAARPWFHRHPPVAA